MISNLESKTNRSLSDWLALIQKSGLSKHGEIVQHLKSEHGLTHGYANMLTHIALNGMPDEQPAADDAEAALFSGKKSGLKPIYDALKTRIAAFGKDVKFSPKKTYMSVRRKKQFALIQPSTATRLDVGLNLKGTQEEGRLESAAGFNAMCSHRIRLTAVEDVDDQVVAWLRDAYQRAG